jgi:hypothetical protein
MNVPAFDKKKSFSNKNNHNWTLPSEEELRFQIEQLEGKLHDDRITLERLIVGVSYFTPVFVIILIATWFALH